MGCCNTKAGNSQNFPDEKPALNDVNLKKANSNEKTIKILENFAYYEKNPDKNGKYTIKKRQIQKTIPILRSISESSLLLKRRISDYAKETESNQTTNEEKPSPTQEEELEISPN